MCEVKKRTNSSHRRRCYRVRETKTRTMLTKRPERCHSPGERVTVAIDAI
ncbi:MAG: hypothetical protein OJF51_003535 [Nitrospira sp.]|nr:MAG: hypothetical protein OJF51_003535 [Nitrospira sp.]